MCGRVVTTSPTAAWKSEAQRCTPSLPTVAPAVPRPAISYICLLPTAIQQRSALPTPVFTMSMNQAEKGNSCRRCTSFDYSTHVLTSLTSSANSIALPHSTLLPGSLQNLLLSTPACNQHNQHPVEVKGVLKEVRLALQLLLSSVYSGWSPILITGARSHVMPCSSRVSRSSRTWSDLQGASSGAASSREY